MAGRLTNRRRQQAVAVSVGLVTAVVLVVALARRADDGADAGSGGTGGDGRLTTVTADAPARPPNAVVVHVVDGDTVDLRIGDTEERVRLIGIDTPESVDPDRPVECYGPEASARTASLIPEGTPVYLERDAEPRDDYGRLLGYVYRAADGLFVNLDLVEQGYATPLTIEPNTAHAADFVAAATRAERSDRGLWGACDG